MLASALVASSVNFALYAGSFLNVPCQFLVFLVKVSYPVNRYLDSVHVSYVRYNNIFSSCYRFRAGNLDLENLVANERYNVRELLLADKNVFCIDFLVKRTG